MIIFLPINGPILRLLLTSLDLPNIGEFKFFVLCIFMFIIGAIMTFTPKLKL